MQKCNAFILHDNDVIMGAMVSQITSLAIVYRLFRHRSKKTSKLRVTGLCAGNSPVNSPHKWPVTRKMFPFDDVIMKTLGRVWCWLVGWMVICVREVGWCLWGGGGSGLASGLGWVGWDGGEGVSWLEGYTITFCVLLSQPSNIL